MSWPADAILRKSRADEAFDSRGTSWQQSGVLARGAAFRGNGRTAVGSVRGLVTGARAPVLEVVSVPQRRMFGCDAHYI